MVEQVSILDRLSSAKIVVQKNWLLYKEKVKEISYQVSVFVVVSGPGVVSVAVAAAAAAVGAAAAVEIVVGVSLCLDHFVLLVLADSGVLVSYVRQMHVELKIIRRLYC